MDLFAVDPIQVTDATLLSSSVPEDDATIPWSSVTGYTTGQRVHLVATHRVYEALGASTNVLPTSSLAPAVGAKWVEVGATLRWRAFDLRLGGSATAASDISYRIACPSTVNTVALFGLSAGSVRVRTYVAGEVVYDVTRELVDNQAAVDAWSYFFGPITYVTEAIFQNVGAYAGAEVQIDILADGGVREVAEIALGFEDLIGRVLIGGSASIVDFSRKDRDDFGNPVLIQRAYSSLVRYPVQYETRRTSSVMRVLTKLRARPAVYHCGEDAADFGLAVFGFFRDLPFSLDNGLHAQLNLEVEGLV